MIDHRKINYVEKYMHFSGHFGDHESAVIAQWRRSMSTLETTERHHQASIHTILPRWLPSSSILAKK